VKTRNDVRSRLAARQDAAHHNVTGWSEHLPCPLAQDPARTTPPSQWKRHTTGPGQLNGITKHVKGKHTAVRSMVFHDRQLAHPECVAIQGRLMLAGGWRQPVAATPQIDALPVSEHLECNFQHAPKVGLVDNTPLPQLSRVPPLLQDRVVNVIAQRTFEAVNCPGRLSQDLVVAIVDHHPRLCPLQRVKHVE